jgi:hypothetical protein
VREHGRLLVADGGAPYLRSVECALISKARKEPPNPDMARRTALDAA